MVGARKDHRRCSTSSRSSLSSTSPSLRRVGQARSWAMAAHICSQSSHSTLQRERGEVTDRLTSRPSTPRTALWRAPLPSGQPAAEQQSAPAHHQRVAGGPGHRDTPLATPSAGGSSPPPHTDTQQHSTAVEETADSGGPPHTHTGNTVWTVTQLV